MALLIHMMVKHYQYHFSISAVLLSVSEYNWKQTIPNFPDEIMNLHCINFVYNQLGSPEFLTRDPYPVAELLTHESASANFPCSEAAPSDPGLTAAYSICLKHL